MHMSIGCSWNRVATAFVLLKLCWIYPKICWGPVKATWSCLIFSLCFLPFSVFLLFFTFLFLSSVMFSPTPLSSLSCVTVELTWRLQWAGGKVGWAGPGSHLPCAERDMWCLLGHVQTSRYFSCFLRKTGSLEELVSSVGLSWVRDSGSENWWTASSSRENILFGQEEPGSGVVRWLCYHTGSSES